MSDVCSAAAGHCTALVHKINGEGTMHCAILIFGGSCDSGRWVGWGEKNSVVSV